MTVQSEKPLYERLGGYDGIARVIGGLYERLLTHPHTWYYWKGRTSDRNSDERRLFAELVCASAGSPAASQDRKANAGYAGLGLSQVEWRFFVDSAGETLNQTELGEWEQEELFCLLASTKAAITPTTPEPSPLALFAGYLHGLTEREREVLQLVALGNNNSEIAAELFISINTVTRHLTNIFAKTNTRNRVQAAVYAARRRLV